MPTAITGCYGRNLPYPGFGQASGVWVSTLVISATLYALFKGRALGRLAHEDHLFANLDDAVAHARFHARTVPAPSPGRRSTPLPERPVQPGTRAIPSRR